MNLSDLKNKSVAIFGFGLEGQAVAHYLLQNGIKPEILEKKSTDKFQKYEKRIIEKNNLAFFSNPEDRLHQHSYDYIFRSPGVYRNLPILKFAEKNTTITSQTKFFFDNYPGTIIGVTGTKGKGTTASLIYHLISTAQSNGQILQNSFLDKTSDLYLTGNIGKVQPLEYLDEASDHSITVYEMSSYQLQDLQISPYISVVLMTTEDHLDVHASLDEYILSKANIAKYQSPRDWCVFNADYQASKTIADQSEAKKISISKNREAVKSGCLVENDKMHFINIPGIVENLEIGAESVPLLGQHNLENAGAAISVALLLGVKPSSIIKSLKTFKALPHRLQTLDSANGINFIDDSIATNPDTAVAGFKAVSGKILAIVGGSDKGLNYDTLIHYIIVNQSKFRVVATVGEMGKAVHQALKNHGLRVDLIDGGKNLTETMTKLKKHAQPNDTVLLSPGFASFDWFDSYAHRGDEFQRIAKEWGKL